MRVIEHAYDHARPLILVVFLSPLWCDAYGSGLRRGHIQWPGKLQIDQYVPNGYILRRHHADVYLLQPSRRHRMRRRQCVHANRHVSCGCLRRGQLAKLQRWQ